MKRSRILVMVVILIHVLPLPVAAQSPTRVVTKTRLQVLFGDLESQWVKAVQKKDTATLDRLLGEEFTVWTGAASGELTPREEWQPAAFAHKPDSFRIEQIAVRAVANTVSVASFRLSEIFGQGETAQTETYFVVDVWLKSGKGEDWKCTDRYISRVDAAQAVKGDIKPTGKD